MSLFEEQGLACQAVDMVQRCITNRASGAEMHRRWLQATFVKGPCPGSHEVCLLLLPQCCVRPYWGAECSTIGLEPCAGLHSMHQDLVPCTCRCEAELHGCAQTAACSLQWAPPEWQRPLQLQASMRISIASLCSLRYLQGTRSFPASQHDSTPAPQAGHTDATSW